MLNGDIDVLELTGDITNVLSLEGNLLPIGPKGDKGDPGFSPVVTTSKSGKTTTVKFETATGDVYAYIQDGADGEGKGDMLTDVYDQNKNGIVDNAEKVNNHTVEKNVPADAVFTDTVYDDTEVRGLINAKPDFSDIPTKVSDLTNDSGFIDNTVNNLTNYYLKTETYTKAEINSLIAQIPGFNVDVVQTLPVSDIDPHTIYLVPKTGSTGDIYDEYLYINNSWELIGSTAVDLTDYVKFTNYATNSKGGVIKTDTSTYGTAMYSGYLTGSTKTYAQYESSANALFVSKGTLENVITGKALTKDHLTNTSSQVDTNYKVNVLTTKNLFDINTTPTWLGADTNYSINNNVLNVSGRWYIGVLVNVKSNTNYYFSATKNIVTSTTGAGNMAIYDNNKQYIKQLNDGGTFNSGNNNQIYIVFYSGGGSAGEVNFSNIQLEEGTTATTYEAFIPNTINVNNEKYTDTINVGTSINDKNRVNVLYSKNLFDINGLVKGRLDSGVIGYESNTTNLTINANSFSFTTNANYRGVTSDYIKVNGTEYLCSCTTPATLNIIVACYDSNKNYLRDSGLTYITGHNNQAKITLQNDVVFIRIYFYLSTSGTITIEEPQLIKGFIYKDYEPYITPSINIDGEEIYNAGKDIITAGFSSDYTLNTTNLYLNVPTDKVYEQIGNNFEINNNNEIICKKDGYVKASIHYNFLYIAGTGTKWVTANLYHTSYNAFINLNATGTYETRLDLSGCDRLVRVYAGDKIRVQVYGTQNDVLRAAYSYITCEYV